MPPQALAPGFAVLFVLGGLLTTPGHAERDNSQPRAPDQPYTCVLGVHLFKNKIDFHQFFKIDLLSLIPHA